MPRFSDPLLAQASDLRSGHYAAVMTPQELVAFEDEIYQNVTKRIALLDHILFVLHERMKTLSENDLKGLLKCARTISRLINKTNYLERFKFWLERRRQIAVDFQAVILLQETEPSSDVERNRSSIKTKKISSKFPPRQVCMDLTDEQWELVKHLLPHKEVVTVGRPPQSMREVLNAILWKIRTGASWDRLPVEYPSRQTCYRYYTAWMRDDILAAIIKLLGKDLRTRGGLDLSSAMKSGEIQMTLMGRKAYITLPSYLQDTWRGSTALAILQFHFKELPSPFPVTTVDGKRPSKLVHGQEAVFTENSSA